MYLLTEFQNIWKETNKTIKEIDKFAIIIGNFNISLLILDRTTRKKSKDIEDVNSTVNQLG